ncbi:glycosyltransferase family 61 protein [Salinibaculum salinum]|uniref:glycosyltransferase family 61 protein n=1 Tax=Salinibaculum salinum TaxID=3131996 RepID=UPI0030EF24A1
MKNKLHTAGRILYEDGPVSLLSSVQDFFSIRASSYPANIMASRIFWNAINNTEFRTRIASETFSYTEGGEFEINESNSKRDLPDEIQSYCRTYSASPLVASVLQDAIINDSSVVLTKDGRLISESIGHSKYALYKRIRRKIRESPVKSIPNLRTDTYADLIPEATAQVELGFFMIRSGSYFHWVTEFLPNLRALQVYETTTGNTPAILVEKDPPDWILEYFKIAGYENSVKPLPSSTISAKQLILPPRRIRIGRNYNPCPRDLVWVRDYFTERVPDITNSYGSRIYISRNDAENRQVVNESELVNELEKRGFESIELSDLSVSEQIDIFRDVDFVVGAHGAGFTNTIFADSTSIFELFPEKGVRHFYYCLAQQLDFDYDFSICPQTTNGDLLVDVETVVERVDDFVKASR